VAALVVDLALDDALVLVVDRVAVAVVVVVVAVVLAPVALVGDLAGALLAGRTDAVRELDESEDVILLWGVSQVVCGLGE
jgi:hypothetical protein